MKQFMKRLVFALAVTLSVLGMKQSVFAENIIHVNKTTFPDDAFRKAVLQSWFYETNGFLEDIIWQYGDNIEIDADQMFELFVASDLKNSKITNLKGIELLTKLESISMPNYYGSKFDLSSNTELRDVYICSKKYALSPNDFSCLKELTGLKLSGKIASNFNCSDLNNLTRLSIFATSDIKRLDISRCKMLKVLSVEADSLESVNLGDTSSIEYIDISRAKGLSSIDVSKHANLQMLCLEDCNIKKLDVSNNKKLKNLFLNGNKMLKSLDVKDNNSLYKVNIGSTSISKLDTSNLKNLRYFQANNTKLSSLDLRNNTKLEELEVANTPLKKLDVTKIKKLKNINIARSKIKSINLKNQKELYGLTYSYGQKISYLSKFPGNYFWINIKDIKKGGSIAVPSICKGYKFSSDKEYSLKYKNNKIITSKKTKKKYAYASFVKGKKSIAFRMEYK